MTISANSGNTVQLRRTLSLRNRLLIAFLLVSSAPVLITAAISGYISSQGLRNEVFTRLAGTAQLKENEVKSWLASLQTNLDLVLKDETIFQDTLAVLQTPENSILARTDLRNKFNDLNKSTGYFQELFILDKNGTIVLSTNALQEGKISKSQVYFREGLKGSYVAPPAYDVALSSYSVVFSRPIKNQFNQIVGVLAGRANLAVLSQIMSERTSLGNAGETYLISSNYAALTALRSQKANAGETYVHTQGTTNVLQSQASGSAVYSNYKGTSVLGAYRWNPELQVAIIAESDETVALKPANTVFAVTLAVMVIMGGFAMLAAILVTRSVATPIAKLVAVAENVTSGNFEVAAPTQRNDEIGVLATAFNTMATRLRELISSLEQRVQERTQALTTVSEISTAASTVLDTDKLLQQVVDLAKERFNFYHAHIYLLNEAGDTLVLSSGAGDVGRQMVAEGRSIPLDREQSLVARTAREKKGVTVNDVTTAPDFLPNPLLPDTHAEMAVPMMVGEQVIGVFDVQSETIGRFTDADIAVQTTLASQVASAIQNSRSFTEIQRSQAQLAEALSISRLGNWEYDVYKDIFTFNDQFYSIFRTTAEKVGGYKIASADYARNFVHPDDAALVGAEIQKALTSKERYYRAALEHRIIFEGGEIGYISVNVNVERDENGKIIRWYGANQDITVRRRLEELNRKRAIEQEAINQITQKIQNTTTIESALQIAARELGHLFGKKPAVVSLGWDEFTSGETSNQSVSGIDQN